MHRKCCTNARTLETTSMFTRGSCCCNCMQRLTTKPTWAETSMFLTQTPSKSHFLQFFTFASMFKFPSSLRGIGGTHSNPPSLFTTFAIAYGKCTFSSQIPNPTYGFFISWEPFFFGALLCLKGKRSVSPVFLDMLFLHGTKAETKTKERGPC